MPLPAELVPRPPPRYYRLGLGKVLFAILLVLFCRLLSLVSEIEERMKADSLGRAPVEVFEITTRASGDVVVCSSTIDGSGTAKSRPVVLGPQHGCSDASRTYVRKFRNGKQGCLAFPDGASADQFMTCYAESV